MNEFGGVLNGPMPAAVLLRFLKTSTMPVRPDWNAMGPRLPLWFRQGLKRIDKRLVLQFVPPSNHAEGGCDPTQHPFGAWAICRRMRRTRWLCKRWVYNLTAPNGLPIPPTRDLLKMLKRATALWRRGQHDRMEDMFDRAMKAKHQAAVEASRARSIDRIEKRLSARRTYEPIKPRVRVPVDLRALHVG